MFVNKLLRPSKSLTFTCYLIDTPSHRFVDGHLNWLRRLYWSGGRCKKEPILRSIVEVRFSNRCWNVDKRFFKTKQDYARHTGLLWTSRNYKAIGSLAIVCTIIFAFDVERFCNRFLSKRFTNLIQDVFETHKNKLRKWHQEITCYESTFPNVEALNLEVLAGEDIETDSTIEQKPHVKTKGKGFRDRKIIEYENRIRMYSTPDKIFRYFATIKIVYPGHETEIFMTPEDFLRALTPGFKQPDGLGLDLFKKIDMSKESPDLSSGLTEALLIGHDKTISFGVKSDSIFYKLSSFGLINFSDFLFLLIVLSVSRRHFEIAFRMFDLNGDGNIEYEEFEKVQNAILQQTSIGRKMGSRVGYKGVSSALAKYFFGEDLKQKLTTEKFLDFQNQLQTEMLTLEFERKHPNLQTGLIKETDFAELLIAYARFPEKKRLRMMKRVKKEFGNGKSSEGLCLDDYLKLFQFLQNINDVDVALTVFHIAGASIDQATLKHVAKTVAHVELRDHLVKVLFTLFDENQDGQLSNREFIAVMKERLKRGLSKPKDTGFMKLLHAIWNSLKFDL